MIMTSSNRGKSRGEHEKQGKNDKYLFNGVKTEPFMKDTTFLSLTVLAEVPITLCNNIHRCFALIEKPAT